jgi:group I intron endonuclease
MKFDYQGHSASGGIYQIKNTNNNKVYIGSASEFRNRWSQHKKELLLGKHGNKHLQSAYNIDGPDVWHFTVLEVVVAETKETGKIARKAAEQVWIDKHYGPECYNIKSKAAVSRADVPSKDPAKTSAKMSKSGKKAWADRAPEVNEKIIAAIRAGHVEWRKTPAYLEFIENRVFSPEGLEALRVANLGNKHCLGRVCSEENKLALSERSIGNTWAANPSEETREKIAAAGRKKKGIKHTPEHRAANSAASKRRIRKPHSEEAKANMRAAAKNRKPKN